MRVRVVASSGEEADVARVYVLELDRGVRIECAESVAPPLPLEKKWILMVSTLRGCPYHCPICDAGSRYEGRLSAGQIEAQLDFLILRRFPSRIVPVEKFKIQFARMGDPVLNDAVLDVLAALPSRFEAPTLMPSISTVAPVKRERFLERLKEIKDQYYSGGRFQMQFSLHTTDEARRSEIVPARTLTFAQMASYGERFLSNGDRKITLNFAAVRGYPLQPERLAETFSPSRFAVKLTPINPTQAAERSGLRSVIDPSDPEGNAAVVAAFEACGYDTLLSIGELDENRIGSNCGMHLRALEASIETCRSVSGAA